MEVSYTVRKEFRSQSIGTRTNLSKHFVSVTETATGLAKAGDYKRQRPRGVPGFHENGIIDSYRNEKDIHVISGQIRTAISEVATTLI